MLFVPFSCNYTKFCRYSIQMPELLQMLGVCEKYGLPGRRAETLFPFSVTPENSYKFLIFCFISRIWGTLPSAMQNPEAPKGACQYRCIKHEITPGHQAPVRPLPQSGSRKFRSSYCLEAEQKKENISLPGSFAVLQSACKI